MAATLLAASRRTYSVIAAAQMMLRNVADTQRVVRKPAGHRDGDRGSVALTDGRLGGNCVDGHEDTINDQRGRVRPIRLRVVDGPGVAPSHASTSSRGPRVLGGSAVDPADSPNDLP